MDYPKKRQQCIWDFFVTRTLGNTLLTRYQRIHVPAWGLIRGNGNTEMVTIGAKLGLCGLFLNTLLTSANTMFKIDWVIIIPHDGTFSDIGQKPPFSVILWPLEGQNLANVAQKRINTEHSSNKCTHQVWIGLHTCTLFQIMVGNYRFRSFYGH